MPETATEKKTTAEEMHIRGFQVRAETFREEDGSFEAVIATELPVMTFDWNEMVEEILLIDGMEVPPIGQVPLLDTHSRYSTKNQLGSVRDIKKVDREAIARLFVSSVEPDTRMKVKEGHITDCSVGYFITAKTVIEPGKSEVINGTTYTAKNLSLHVATSWLLKETSLCPIGADIDAKIRSFEIGADLKERLADLLTGMEWRKKGMAEEKDVKKPTEPEAIIPPAAPDTRELVPGVAAIPAPEIQRRAEIME